VIGRGDEKAETEAEAAGTPLNPVAKSAKKKTAKVRKTSRGK
jgi:hypothetical protein